MNARDGHGIMEINGLPVLGVRKNPFIEVTPTSAIDTTTAVQLVMKGKGFLIGHISLHLEARVAEIDEDTFQKIAAAAKPDCPLSEALASVPEITLTAVLRK